LQWKMLVYFMDINFTAIWYTLWTLGIFGGNLVYFPRFRYVVPIKIWQPWLHMYNVSGEQGPMLRFLKYFRRKKLAFLLKTKL
jgi:hypothetical protein